VLLINAKMVAFTEITANNTSIASLSTTDLTAVVVGGTNGIGLGALKSLTKHAASPTIYIVGRSEKRIEDLIATSLKPLNEKATFHPVIAEDLTLISDAQKAAQQIMDSGVKKIDLLIMSPGYISFNREMSPEGVDRLTSIRYYARLRILTTLLPLLRAAPSPRVVSVLGSGLEGQLWPDDWTMEQHWGLMNAAGVSSSLMTFMFEELAAKDDNKKISFIHLYPGLVGDTGLQIQGLGAVGNFFVKWVAQPLMWVFGYSGEEAGERVLYAATSEKFTRGSSEIGSNGTTGSGVYLVQGDSSVLEASKVAKKMREEGMAEKVYEHTVDVFDKVEKL
jgi:NAD(P)-dependent dehydrogenase (short-subunit alcohol dehydrogenase family)